MWRLGSTNGWALWNLIVVLVKIWQPVLVWLECFSELKAWNFRIRQLSTLTWKQKIRCFLPEPASCIHAFFFSGFFFTCNVTLLAFSPQMIRQVLDSITHDWLPTPHAVLEHACSDGASYCKVSQYAQGSDLWHQFRQLNQSLP